MPALAARARPWPDGGELPDDGELPAFVPYLSGSAPPWNSEVRGLLLGLLARGFLRFRAG